MRTRSSSKFVGEPFTNLKRRNRRRSKQRVEPFALEKTPVVTMADQRTMAELLCAPTEGYAEAIVVGYVKAIVVPPIHAKFINHFFPPSKTTNLRNEISNFQQRFDDSFYEAWDRFKDLLRACPHHGFTELHQLDTFYNGLNPTEQDSLNSANDLNPTDQYSLNSLASVKAVEESCVTCGGAHSYRQCPATDGNTFLGYQDNIQGYVSAAAVNYNQGNTGYRS
ncbi:reverse transcriptase domain-containing protein [Tanacetum coccineum]